MFPPEGVQASPLGHVPDADELVLAVGEDELVSRVEQHAGHVVVVATACVHFPRLGSLVDYFLLLGSCAVFY